MITGIDHIQITVPADGVDQARAFDCGLVGLREVEKPDSLKGRGGLWVQAGDRQVHMGIEERIDRRTTGAHIAHRVAGIDGWRDRLAAAGVEAIEGIPIPGYKHFEFHDPFGNRVEFIEASRSSVVRPASHGTVAIDRGGPWPSGRIEGRRRRPSALWRELEV